MTPIEGTQEQVNKLIVNQVCAEHGERVTAVWDGRAGICMVKCAKGEYPARLKPVETRVQQYKRSTDVVVPVGFGNCPTTDLGDYHKLTGTEVQALRAYAAKYGLDADRGHVFAMFSQAYIGLDGYIYHAKRTRTPYKLGTRPMTPAEFKLYKIEPDDYAWIAEGWVEGKSTGDPGIGIVQEREINEMSAKHPEQKRYPVVAAHPQLIAQKRAAWQWYRRYFPIGAESDEDRDDTGGTVTATVEPTPEQIDAAATQ